MAIGKWTIKSVAKAIALLLTWTLFFWSGVFMFFAMGLGQVDGVFAYGILTMVFGVALKLEVKHWF